MAKLGTTSEEAGVERLILVVQRAEAAAENLKELIEFMDTPCVCTTPPDRWRERIGAHRLEALFIGDDLAEPDLEVLLNEIGDYDPNVPIILMTDATSQ